MQSFHAMDILPSFSVVGKHNKQFDSLISCVYWKLQERLNLDCSALISRKKRPRGLSHTRKTKHQSRKYFQMQSDTLCLVFSLPPFNKRFVWRVLRFSIPKGLFCLDIHSTTQSTTWHTVVCNRFFLYLFSSDKET